MGQPTASTSYKKQDGILALSVDQDSVTWSPAQLAGAPAALTLGIMSIKNLQQTPADKPKVMLKIFAAEPGQTEPVAHTFTFTSRSDARGEANAIRDSISAAMAKANQNSITRSAGGQSAAMTIAAAISGGKGNSWEDDDKLVADVRLQQALLKDNPELHKTFMEARNVKPESLSLTQFTKQFWSSRVHLLRAHALSQSQSKGLYNVFSEIKRSDGGKSLNLTSEHIRAIFEQYPIMRIVYDEVVPRKIKEEQEFWSRFFQSQLYSTLRGLKVDRKLEAKDAVLDMYLDHPQLTGLRATSSEMHIPKFIDLEGNEENHSQRKGNQPDIENRQNSLDKGPIIRRLNAISEKLMAAVRPSDVDASAPIGMDEHEFEQLRLRDLSAREEHQRVALNIRDQSRFFSDNRASAEDVEVARIRALNPATAIQKVSQDLEEHYSNSKKRPIVDIVVDEEDEDEYMMDIDDQKSGRQISGSSLANEHILSLVSAHREQSSEASVLSGNQKSYGGLSEAVYERLVLTHATTLEFLRQFWSAFLSGDPSRTEEVASLVESLSRALERINTIAKDAQDERDTKLKALKAQALKIYQQTGKKKRVDEKALGGGEVIVRDLLGPCIKGLGIAVEKYKTAYEEQLHELQQGDEAR